MITDEEREMVQIITSNDFDQRAQKFADALGLDKKRVIQAMVESQMTNAVADNKSGAMQLNLYTQEEWMNYVTEQCYKLYESGEIEKLKDQAKEFLSNQIH